MRRRVELTGATNLTVAGPAGPGLTRLRNQCSTRAVGQCEVRTVEDRGLTGRGPPCAENGQTVGYNLKGAIGSNLAPS